MRRHRFLFMLTLFFTLLYYNLGNASTFSKDIVFLIDNSGSMKKGDPDFLTKKAIVDFVKKLPTDIQVAVLIFDHRVNLALPLTVVSETNKEAILASLDQIDYRGILTNIPDAVRQAIIELKTNGQDNSQKSIIFITDGVVDTGKKSRDIEKIQWLKKNLSKGASKHGIKIFGIAFTNLADFELIKFMVQKTKGEYFKALTPEEIPEVFISIYQNIMGREPASAELSRKPLKAPSAISEESKPERVTVSGEKPLHAPKESDQPTQKQPLEPPPSSEIAQSPIYITEKPEPTPAPIKKMSEEPESDTPPVKHIMKKSSNLISPQSGSKSRKLPLPLPVMIFITVIIITTVIVVWYRLRKRKISDPKLTPQSLVGPPEPDHPIRIPAEFMPEALLRDRSGITGEETYKINEKITKIGREEQNNQIVINQDTVSREHAAIEYKNYAYWISDQGSSNGTFLNGEKIIDETQLNNGDTLSIDAYDFEFIMPRLKLDRSGADKTVFRKPQETQG